MGWINIGNLWGNYGIFHQKELISYVLSIALLFQRKYIEISIVNYFSESIELKTTNNKRFSKRIAFSHRKSTTVRSIYFLKPIQRKRKSERTEN